MGILSGNGGNIGNIGLGGNFDSLFADIFGNSLGSGFDTALQEHRVGAGCQALQTFGNDGVSQNSGSGGAVTGDVICFRGSFLQKLGAHVFKRIGKFNFFRNSHAVVSDGRAAVFLIDGDIAAFRAQGRGNSVGDDINTDL